MRKFQHKKMLRVAEQISQYKCKVLVNDSEGVDEFLIPLLIVQDSSDREEVVEKDWFDQVIEEMEIRDHPITSRSFKIDLKELIEQYAPKQVKFTKNELAHLQSYATPNDTYISWNGLINFLQEHNLLSDTD